MILTSNRNFHKYYLYKCTEAVPQVICEIDGKLVSSTENPTTKYTEPEEVTEFNKPDSVGTARMEFFLVN